MPKNVSHSAMSKRLMELAAEFEEPAPYPVTETLVVKPLTRTRRQQMHEAEGKMYVFGQALVSVMRSAGEAAPELPDDASDEQRLDYGVAFAAWEKRTAQLKSKVDTINAQNAEAQADYEQAFFGDAHDAVLEFFEDKPALWGRFVEDIKSEFLPETPSDGMCPTCGRVDEDQAGKVPESST